MKSSNLSILLVFMILNYLNIFCGICKNERPITIAILAKDKAACLPLYLTCLEKQSWPASKTNLYIRTNNNKDDTAQILKDWVEKVKDRYLEIYFDETDVPQNIQQYGHHEWNGIRLKILCQIRNESLKWAHTRGSHYFVADCDNFILPDTIKTLLKTNLSLVAPLLWHGRTVYSNYHANVDHVGYFKDSPFYMPILNGEVKGLIRVPVIHCTYLVRYDVLSEMTYDDESWRYDYVIFSDTARKKALGTKGHKFEQYIDNRKVYGHLTFAENAEQLHAEPWFNNFSQMIYNHQPKTKK